MNKSSCIQLKLKCNSLLVLFFNLITTTTKVSNNIKDSCTKNELIEHVLRTRTMQCSGSVLYGGRKQSLIIV